MADIKIETEEKKVENTGASLYGPQYLDRMNKSAAALDEIAAARPADYSSKYQPQIDLAMEKVLQRPDFKYNVNEDALYQQYKDRFTQLGRTAMQDTMGQAAQLTGGYGSTYGQRVGQQTYDQYMQGLTDKIPELYQLALDKYDRDYAYDKDRLSILDAADQKDYGRWGDTMSLWQNDRNYAGSRYDTDASMAMATGDALYTRLQALISMGYQPTEDELRAAGMDAQQLLALQGKLRGGGGGGGGGGGPKSDLTYDTKNVLSLGYGPISENTLADKISSGQVSVTTSGNKLSFSNTPTKPATPTYTKSTPYSVSNPTSLLTKKP